MEGWGHSFKCGEGGGVHRSRSCGRGGDRERSNFKYKGGEGRGEWRGGEGRVERRGGRGGEGEEEGRGDRGRSSQLQILWVGLVPLDDEREKGEDHKKENVYHGTETLLMHFPYQIQTGGFFCWLMSLTCVDTCI